MGAKVAMDARALDTDENAKVDGGPVGVVSSTVGTLCVGSLDVLHVDMFRHTQRVKNLALDTTLPADKLLRGTKLEMPLSAAQRDQSQFMS